MKTFLETIDSIRKYNKGLPTKDNGISIIKFGEGIKTFEKQLSEGEVFEHYLVQLINDLTPYKAIKIPFVNFMKEEYLTSLYHKFNHVDIALYATKEANVEADEPILLIDCKIQCRTFMKAKEYVNIEPEKCVIVNRDALEYYKRNNITTLLAVYMANGLTKEGLYIQNVRSVSSKIFKVNSGYTSSGNVKANLTTDEMVYYKEVEEFVNILEDKLK